jgi:predicted nuclease of restriction endonuclease-like (RecB) superfamily
MPQLNSDMELQEHFEQVRRLIRRGQVKALQVAYHEQLRAFWYVGAYVYYRLQSGEWGDKTVVQLSNWLYDKEPALKGFDSRSLYRMKEFYFVWHKLDWDTLKKDGSVIETTTDQKSQINDNQSDIIVVTLSPQFKHFPNILASLNWSSHIDLLGKTRSPEEKVFYFLLAIREKYTVRELRRQLSSGLYERQKLSSQQLVGNQHPGADLIPQLFRDKYIFEFLDLPEPHSENDLQQGLVRRLKQFVLEIGKDFSFVGEGLRVQAGMHDYYLDLLFFHRELRCLVVFELRSKVFSPNFWES